MVNAKHGYILNAFTSRERDASIDGTERRYGDTHMLRTEVLA
jgi:hypothetical protein